MQLTDHKGRKYRKNVDRASFVEYMRTLIFQEGHQCKKGRIIALSLMKQKQAINKIAQALGLQKLTLDEVSDLSHG